MLDARSGTKHELDCTLDELRIVLDRTGSRLDEKDKNVILKQFENHDPKLFENDFLLFYLLQLLMIYRSQEKYDSAINAENGGYPPTQNGDIRSLFWLFSLMALQN